MAEVSGKNVVITGGSSGIGLEVIRKCLHLGAAKVAVLDIRDNENTIANLQKEFPDKEVIYLQTDVSDSINVRHSFEQATDKFGHLDIVIGNAGIADESKPERTILINLIGVMNSTFAAIEYMSKTHGGHGGVIINVASMAGLNLYCGLPSYAASKHGIVGFTQSFGHQYYSTVYGIKFLTVCPGFTPTPLLQALVMFDFDNDAHTRYLADKQTQTVDQAADAIVQVLQEGEHGSIWSIQGGELEEVSIKQYWKAAQQIDHHSIGNMVEQN